VRRTIDVLMPAPVLMPTTLSFTTEHDATASHQCFVKRVGRGHAAWQDAFDDTPCGQGRPRLVGPPVLENPCEEGIHYIRLGTERSCDQTDRVRRSGLRDAAGSWPGGQPLST